MFIQIFTETIQSAPNEYYLVHSHYLDCEFLERKKLVWKAQSKTIAELCNIGFAMRENVEQDRKIGIVWRSVKKNDWWLTKHGITQKVWTEYASGVRRNVTIYTGNESVYNDLKTGFFVGNANETKYFNRILQLKNDFSIGIGHLTEQDITDTQRNYWYDYYKIERNGLSV